MRQHRQVDRPQIPRVNFHYGIIKNIFAMHCYLSTDKGCVRTIPLLFAMGIFSRRASSAAVTLAQRNWSACTSSISSSCC